MRAGAKTKRVRQSILQCSPKAYATFFFFNDLSSSSNSLSSFLSTPFDEIQDPGSILKKFNKKIHTQPHNPTSPYALCLTSLQNQEKKVFQKKRETTKKKVWIIMDTSSKKPLNQFGSVDGCNHTHHTHHIHSLVPTPHHTIPKQSTHAQTHSRPYNPDRNSQLGERKLIPKFSTTTSIFFSSFHFFFLSNFSIYYLPTIIYPLRTWSCASMCCASGTHTCPPYP